MPKNRPAWNRARNNWDRDLAKQMYAEGEPVVRIGAEVGCCGDTVGRVARREKWPRGAKPRMTSAEKNLRAKFYQRNASIAAAYYSGHRTVDSIARQYGLAEISIVSIATAHAERRRT